MNADNHDPKDAPAGAQAGTPSMRGEPRDSMLLMASLRRAGGTEVPIKVRNLSSGGLMAETPVHLLKDEPVEVDLRGIGIIGGRVAWTTGSRVGLAFGHTIDHRKARRQVSGGPQPLLLMRAARDPRRPSVR